MDAVELVQHIERIRRRWWSVGQQKPIIESGGGGWITIDESSANEQYASSNKNRAHWCTDSPPSLGDVEAAIALLRARGIGRGFLWFGPGAWSEALGADLSARGLRVLTEPGYVGLSRRVGPGAPPIVHPLMAGGLRVRRIEPGEAEDWSSRLGPWYGSSAGLGRMAADGGSALFMAVDGPDEVPVAAALATIDGPVAYLGCAGTSPEHRGRGGQSGLIAARAQWAADQGCTWCASETITILGSSLRNLERAGFAEAFRMRVVEWVDS